MFEDTPTAKRVFLYLRKSTDTKDKQVRSLDDQEACCMELAKRMGLTVVEKFCEKRSAYTPKARPEFNRMLKELSYKSAERRRADAVLTYSVCRLSRNPLEGGMVMQQIWDKQLHYIYFCNYPFYNNSAGREHLMMEFARAAGDNQRRIDVVNRGVHSREAQGAMMYPNKFGYTKKREYPTEPKRCSLFPVPDGDKFEAIKEVFNLALRGMSLSAISTQLNRNYPHIDNKFHKANLSRWLNDPFYYGLWVVNAGKDNERQYDLRERGKQVGIEFEPVIAEPLFRQVQAKLAGRHVAPRDYHAKRLPNPFPQRLVCERCGKKLRGVYRNPHRADKSAPRQLGFECQTKHEDGTRCVQGRVKAKPLTLQAEKRFDELIPKLSKQDYGKYLLATQGLVSQQRTSIRQKNSQLQRRKEALKKQQRELLEAKTQLVTAGEYKGDSKKHYEAALAKVKRQLIDAKTDEQAVAQKLEHKILSYESFMELLGNLHQHWANANYEKKGKIMEIMASNLVVKDTQIRSVTWKKPFDEVAKRASVSDGAPWATQVEGFVLHCWQALDVFELDEDCLFSEQIKELAKELRESK